MTLFEVYSFYHSRLHPVCASSFEVIWSFIAATEVKFSANNKQNITEYLEWCQLLQFIEIFTLFYKSGSPSVMPLSWFANWKYKKIPFIGEVVCQPEKGAVGAYNSFVFHCYASKWQQVTVFYEWFIDLFTQPIH